MNVVDRVKNILITPQTEFATVKAESASVQQIYTDYLLFVAALPALGNLLSFGQFGELGGFGFGLRLALVSYIAALVSFYASALVIDNLATNFSSTKDMVGSFKLVAYAATPAMVAGVLAFVPGLYMIASLAGLLYSVYLFYLGLPILKNTPQDKVVPYMIASFIVSLIAFFLVAAVLSPLFGVNMRWR